MNVRYFLDKNLVRYQLVESNSGKNYNWTFLPGGPGADSSYLRGLIHQLKLPGNNWLIDFPNNGSNIIDCNHSYGFNHWLQIFEETISQFPNVILVGHSFGGMLPLLYPKLENILKGFVMLSVAPSLWFDESLRLTEAKGLPPLHESMKNFSENPNEETFKEALMACMPYYFPPETLEKGKDLLKDVPFNYHAAAWGQKKLVEMNFNAVWIPHSIPTLIISGNEDYVTPYSIFEKDTRFFRDNIAHKKISNAGHFPWVEKPEEINSAFKDFISLLN